jgi:hypothetical protein
VLESTIGDGIPSNLFESLFPSASKLNDSLKFWDQSGATELRELSLLQTVVNIGDLGLNEITVVVVVGCVHDGTKRNSALHVLVDKTLRFIALNSVFFKVDVVTFKVLVAIQVIKSDNDGLWIRHVLGVYVESIGGERVDALASVGLTVLQAISAGSIGASWGTVNWAVTVVGNVTEAAVPAWAHSSALVVDGNGADMLNLNSAQVELEPLHDESGVLGSDLLDLLDVVHPEDFADGAARVVGLALLEVNPSVFNCSSSLGDSRFDGLLEVGEGCLPDSSDLLTELSNVALAASGTFITSFEESTVLSFHLGKGSLVDHVLMVTNEGAGGVGVPGLDFSLDLVKVDILVGDVSDCLLHVAFRCGCVTNVVHVPLLDSVGSGQSSGDNSGEFHQFKKCLYK